MSLLDARNNARIRPIFGTRGETMKSQLYAIIHHGNCSQCSLFTCQQVVWRRFGVVAVAVSFFFFAKREFPKSRMLPIPLHLSAHSPAQSKRKNDES